jgi:hypothetical protein
MNKFVFRDVEVEGIAARIPKKDRDPEYYYYELRHGDEPHPPLTIEHAVMVNFYGTIRSVLPILVDGEVIDLTEDESYDIGSEM